MCEDYSTRILIEDDYSNTNPEDYDYNYIIDGNLGTGRIEVCIQGTWSPVCQDVWTNQEASVACYQMGFSRYGVYYCKVVSGRCVSHLNG